MTAFESCLAFFSVFLQSDQRDFIAPSAGERPAGRSRETECFS